MTNWTHHGNSIAPQLAGALPRQGVHFLIGDEGSGRSPIAADLAVAIAAGDVGCGLSQPDSGGARRSLAGFFGHAAGAPANVAIIADTRHAASISNAISAAALARGVVGALPISWASSNRFNSADGVRAMAAHVARHGEVLSLVIVDELDFTDPEMALSVIAIQRSARCAVLVVCKEPPASLIVGETAVLETSNGVLTLAKPASGETWAREFSLDRIMVGDAEALAVRPGKVAAVAPSFKYVARTAPAPKSEPERPIVARVVLAFGADKITNAERARWPGFDGFVKHIGEAVLMVEQNSAKGRTEIIIAEPARGWDVREEAQRLETELKTKGLLDAALVSVAKQRLLAA